jgi:hypothetical protein
MASARSSSSARDLAAQFQDRVRCRVFESKDRNIGGAHACPPRHAIALHQPFDRHARALGRW